MPFRICLHSPQIPQNTGNIVRTCAVTGCSLILIEPLGFRPTDRQLKRAGLDYWLGVDVSIRSDLHSLLEETRTRAFFFSSRAKQCYTNASYERDDLLVFGSETSGLPEALHKACESRFYRLPMVPDKRCLNLASAATAVIYEAWRQVGFAGSDEEGQRPFPKGSLAAPLWCDQPSYYGAQVAQDTLDRHCP